MAESLKARRRERLAKEPDINVSTPDYFADVDAIDERNDVQLLAYLLDLSTDVPGDLTDEQWQRCVAVLLEEVDRTR